MFGNAQVQEQQAGSRVGSGVRVVWFLFVCLFSEQWI